MNVDPLVVESINMVEFHQARKLERGLLDKFQYCDSNIELFSIAPSLVIALPTLR